MTSVAAFDRPRGLVPLRGRDPGEPDRASSRLELLFDLSFAVAFGIAGGNLAQLLAAGQVGPGLAGFAFASFAIVWGWINDSWFASAYDTDDWGCRVVAMAMMVGAVITAHGFNPMFASLAEGGVFDNRTVVLGYVVMRLSLLVGWARAWHDDPGRRPQVTRYIVSLVVAQVGWILAAFLPLRPAPALAVVAVLVAVEMSGPWLAERTADGTPWHPYHIADRYSALAIITLGEGVIGTVATLSAVLGRNNWSLDAVLVVVAGIGLTFGLWWTYFILDAGEILQRYRERSFVFGYVHIPVFACIAATGAALQVAGLWIAGRAEVDEFFVVACLAVPVACHLLLFYLFSYAMLRSAATGHLFHAALGALTMGVIALALVLAARGVPVGWCLLAVAMAPVVNVVGYEVWGHQHMAVSRRTIVAGASD